MFIQSQRERDHPIIPCGMWDWTDQEKGDKAPPLRLQPRGWLKDDLWELGRITTATEFKLTGPRDLKEMSFLWVMGMFWKWMDGGGGGSSSQPQFQYQGDGASDFPRLQRKSSSRGIRLRSRASRGFTGPFSVNCLSAAAGK